MKAWLAIALALTSCSKLRRKPDVFLPDGTTAFFIEDCKLPVPKPQTWDGVDFAPDIGGEFVPIDWPARCMNEAHDLCDGEYAITQIQQRSSPDYGRTVAMCPRPKTAGSR